MDKEKVSHVNKRIIKKVPLFAILLALLALALGLLNAWLWLIPHGQRIDSQSYQVVYLNNNQAYFGKLKNTGGDYLVLESPYIVQEIKAPADDTKKAEDTQVQTTLVKVRDQVYGPDDSIALSSKQVLFWQNLRSDSKVAKAIKAKE